METIRARFGGFKYHEYKENKYQILQVVKMKDPSSREWVDAVVYCPAEGKFQMYVREMEDFKVKFKGISHDG